MSGDRYKITNQEVPAISRLAKRIAFQMNLPPLPRESFRVGMLTFNGLLNFMRNGLAIEKQYDDDYFPESTTSYNGGNPVYSFNCDCDPVPVTAGIVLGSIFLH